MKQVTLIGDSIRLHMQKFVVQGLEGRAQVWGPEENGGTSQKVLDQVMPEVLEHKADIVHVNAGLHDLARLPENKGEPRVTLEQYRKNVRQIITTLREKLGATVIWATTTPVNEKRHSERKSFERREADVQAYNAVALEVCKELDVPVNDLYSLVMSRGRDEMLLPDGVHYPEESSQVLAAVVVKAIESYL